MVHPVKRRFAKIGPRPIPQIPIAQFSKLQGKATNEMLKDLWEIIGPSVEQNIDRLPIWKVICMAYFEGSLHAMQMMEEENGN